MIIGETRTYINIEKEFFTLESSDMETFQASQKLSSYLNIEKPSYRRSKEKYEETVLKLTSLLKG